MSVLSGVKRLFKHSMVYGMGHILNRMIVFLLIPLYTNTFSQDLLGVYTLIFSYIAILTIIYSYGLDTAFFRFYIIEDDTATRNRVFSTAFITLFATSLFFSLLIHIFRAPIAQRLFSPDIHRLGLDLNRLITWSVAILFFDSLTLMPFLILRAEEKPGWFIFFKFINVCLNFGLNTFFIVRLKMGLEAIFIGNFWASALTFVIMLPICLKHFRFTFSRPTLRDLLKFGLPYLPATLSVNLMDTLDKIILEKLDSVEAVGLYGPSAKLGMFMALFIAAFRFAWHPFFLSTVKQPDAKEIFKKVLTYLLLACSLVFLFFSLFIDDIVRLRIGRMTLLGEEYWSGTVVVPIIFLAYIAFAAYLNFIIGIYLEKKTGWLPLITGAGIVTNVIALYTLIPLFGFVGAAWARVVAYVVMAVVQYFVNHRFYAVNYEWGRIVKMALAVAVCFFVGRSSLAAGHLLLRATIFLSFPLLLSLLRFYEKNEREVVRAVLRRLSGRLA
ncbi:MAG: oligosaccharide flippase family protein [candidate division KSB1 bacterium]|nr:oligosaccharide flippase family protein [candidate division KSB1 bacterium]MDZ7346000.1 oligosaccharide flippase family protein [candidate division KSB1 bacterium]